jgi:hypothetical protein
MLLARQGCPFYSLNCPSIEREHSLPRFLSLQEFQPSFISINDLNHSHITAMPKKKYRHETPKMDVTPWDSVEFHLVFYRF